MAFAPLNNAHPEKGAEREYSRFLCECDLWLHVQSWPHTADNSSTALAIAGVIVSLLIFCTALLKSLCSFLYFLLSFSHCAPFLLLFIFYAFSPPCLAHMAFLAFCASFSSFIPPSTSFFLFLPSLILCFAWVCFPSQAIKPPQAVTVHRRMPHHWTVSYGPPACRSYLKIGEAELVECPVWAALTRHQAGLWCLVECVLSSSSSCEQLNT